jgi:KaiC/GvpD/RAD55 family RecA-like ATPase
MRPRLAHHHDAAACLRCDRVVPSVELELGVCRACTEFEAEHDPMAQSFEQTAEAVGLLERDPSRIVAWPFAAVDAVTGPMAPGTVWYVAAFSGGGKTTFTTSCIRRWVEAGVRVYVMPLELRAHEWRTGYLCQRLGVHPGDALSGRLRLAEAAGDLEAKRTREMLQHELQLSHDEDRAWSLYVNPAAMLSLDGFVRAARHAKRHGYHVIVVDHVDHVSDEGASPLEVSQQVNRALGRIAQALDIVIVCTTQMNGQAASGHRLAKYEPPQVNHIWHPGVKVQTATGILGLYRPTDPAASLDDVNAAKRGEIEPTRVLLPGCMGVVAMKLRNYGAHEGKRVELAVQRGAVEDRAPQDVHHIHTGGASERARGWR